MERNAGLPLKCKNSIGGCDIFVGKNIAEHMPEMIRSLCPEGTVVLLYDGGVSRIAEDVRDKLRGDGFSLFCKDVDVEGAIPEYARLIFGVGTGRVAKECKRIANDLSVDCALFVTAPSTDSILTDGKRVEHVYLDENVLNACPEECLAAGWGIVMSAPLTEFESYFRRTILNEQPPCKPKSRALQQDATPLELALKLIEDSAYGEPADTAAVMAKLLYDADIKRGAKPRLLGEYKFLSASVLFSLYGSYLGSPCIDCALPPSADKTVDEIVRATSRTRESVVNSFDFLSVNSYFRINYILGEYRLDLLERLKEIDFHSAAKRWRRIYPDAGYWLKSTFTAGDLIGFLGAAGLLGGGLARCIYQSGFTSLCA